MPRDEPLPGQGGQDKNEVCVEPEGVILFADGPGIACFGAGNKYAHGGLSPQECLIPVLRITSEAGVAKDRASIVNVSWVGLRCRVRIEASHAGLPWTCAQVWGIGPGGTETGASLYGIEVMARGHAMIRQFLHRSTGFGTEQPVSALI